MERLMPRQSKIINIVNRCLKQKTKIDFEFNKGGVCGGLAGLYVKYALENKTNLFFNVLERLSKLPPDYQLGDDPSIDDVIIQIEKVFNPKAYSNYQIGQEDLEKILSINNMPIINEFNFGLITEDNRWENILQNITRNNRAYSIMSTNHAIAVSYKNGKYSIYDPNYHQKTKEFVSAKEVIQELKKCFNYTSELNGLHIRVFAHPKATPESYPDHTELHPLAFLNLADKIRTIMIKKNQHQSLEFAASARDIKTLVYLMDQKVINWYIVAQECLFPEFNNLLIKHPPFSELKKIILTSISVNLMAGNVNTVKNLIDHYKQTFISADDQKILKMKLQGLFNNLGGTQLGVMKYEANYSSLLKLCEEFALATNVNAQININHLKLLSLFAEESNQEQVALFLNTLTPEQVILQIQTAALFNQHHILNVLINQLKKSNINPQLFPTIFTEQMIKTINAPTLKILLENGFLVNTKEPNLIINCTERNDKTIFELFARAFSEQLKQSNMWEQIDTHSYTSLDLTTMIGPVLLINTLIFLKKNEHIKNAWKEGIPEDIIKSALITAIIAGNTEISSFLQKKLHSTSASLEEDTVSSIYKKALIDKDLTILATLAALNFNIFTVTEDIKKIMFLCNNNNDYSVIELALPKASPPMKQKILQTALKFNAKTILELCAALDPQMFNQFLNHWVNQESSSTRDNYLLDLNATIKLLPTDTLNPKLNETKQKAFFNYCFHHKLFALAGTFSSSIKWTPSELAQLLADLIKSKKEEATLQLLQNYPQLMEDPTLLNTLIQNNCLKPIALLLTPEIKFSPDQYEEIFITALTNDDKNLIEKLLAQGKITPETKLKTPLAELLESVITKGNESVLEPFINSNLDYGLNFKHLFFFCCKQKQTAIANLLLAKNLALNEEEVSLAAKQLFNEQSPPAIFETIYQNAYGRLYPLIIKANIYNPRTDLLSSIKKSDQDPQFRQTDLYLSPLKRAFKDKNKSTFIKLLKEVPLPQDPDSAILHFLKNPITASLLIASFKDKYSLEQLMSAALAAKDWSVVANLIEKHQLTDFSPRMQEKIKDNGTQIISDFITNLAAHYETEDVRARLFQLLYLPTENPKILNQFAVAHYEHIQKTLVSIELNMISKKINLNGQIYRHTYSNKSQSNTNLLAELKEQCNQGINNYLTNRDHTLSYLSYYFDYEHGKIRAQHYQHLINAAQTPEELYIIQYAMITNNDGKQLKKDSIDAFGFLDERDAKNKLKNAIIHSRLGKYATELDNVIDSINQKANSNDLTPSATLFSHELAYFTQSRNSPTSETRHSFFYPQNQSLWQKIINSFSTDDKLSPK